MAWVLRKDDDLYTGGKNVPGVACFMCSRFTPNRDEDGRFPLFGFSDIDEINKVEGLCCKAVTKVPVKGFDNCIDFDLLRELRYVESRPVYQHLREVRARKELRGLYEELRELKCKLKAEREKARALRATVKALKAKDKS
ncbi:Uncharacterised protein [Burkholderia pseudomallei]|nr:Uncharacterised protein [Burkholderia pseudomallei]